MSDVVRNEALITRLKKADATKRAKAKLFFVSNPADGVLIANIQTEGGAYWQIEISRAQLALAIMDGVKLLFPHASADGDATHHARLTSPKRGNGSGALNQQSGEGSR